MFILLQISTTFLSFIQMSKQHKFYKKKTNLQKEINVDQKVKLPKTIHQKK